VIGTLHEVRDDGVTRVGEEKRSEQTLQFTWEQIAEGRPQVTF
jgi:hypothetical protein